MGLKDFHVSYISTFSAADFQQQLLIAQIRSGTRTLSLVVRFDTLGRAAFAGQKKSRYQTFQTAQTFENVFLRARQSYSGSPLFVRLCAESARRLK